MEPQRDFARVSLIFTSKTSPLEFITPILQIEPDEIHNLGDEAYRKNEIVKLYKNYVWIKDFYNRENLDFEQLINEVFHVLNGKIVAELFMVHQVELELSFGGHIYDDYNIGLHLSHDTLTKIHELPLKVNLDFDFYFKK